MALGEGVTKAALVALAVLLCVGVPSVAQARKLYPVDEGKRNASFRAFRQKLVTALRQWDRPFVLSVLDPKIVFSFVDTGSIQGFKREWKLDQPGYSWGKLRSELLGALALGGSFDRGGFEAPYTSSKWPETRWQDDETDPLEYAAILGRGVAIRSGRHRNAPILTRLTYDLVKVPDGPGTPLWVKIITPNGKRGYVAASQIRSPIDYRAGFEKVKGRWRLAFFIAGD